MGAVKVAKLYTSTESEPRIYSPERLAEAGYITTRGLPSVTTILGRVLHKPAFVPAALKAMSDHLMAHEGEPVTEELVTEAKAAWGARSRKAMDTGSRIHTLCEAHGRGENVYALLEDEPLEVVRGFDAYITWVREMGFVATSIERVVANPQIGYAGMCDAVGRLPDGTEILVDWKSSKGIYQEYLLQWHAYAAPLGIDRGYIVRFDKDTGEVEHHDVRWDALTYGAFQACVEIYEWMEK